MTYILDKNTPGIDINSVIKLSSLGYDLFNSSDPFFNDICIPYDTDNNTDIPLKDRRIDMLQNVSLCDTGCSYKSFNSITYEVKCECNVKTELSFIEKEPNKSNIFKTLLVSTNIMIVRCYNLITILNNYQYNIGFYIFFGIFIMSL